MQIRKGGHVDLEHYYSAMEIDFDEKELLSKWSIHRAISAGDQELLIFSDEQTRMDVGYALVMCRSLYGYALLKYFGIFPWFRGQGQGIEAMRLINKRYAEKQGILAELTAFDDGEGDLLRKLKRFFARFGYVELPSDYRLGGAPVTLMVKPIQGDGNIAPVAHRIIRDVYSRCLGFDRYSRMVDIRPVRKDV